MATDPYDYRQVLSEAIQGGAMGAAGGGGMADLGMQADIGTEPEDPYQQRIQQLIAQLSEPDEPQLVPTINRPGTAQNIMAILADALSNVGAAKENRPLPGPVWTLANQQRREYADQTAAENESRKREVVNRGKKRGALLELQDIQSERSANDRAVQKSVTGRAAYQKDLAARAFKAGGVPMYDKDGNPRPDNAIESDIAQWKQKADKEHLAHWDKNFEIKKQMVAIRRERLAQQAKVVAKQLASTGTTKEERAAKSTAEARIRVLLKTADEATAKGLQAAKNFDDEGAQQWSQTAQDSLDEADQIAQDMGTEMKGEKPVVSGSSTTAAPGAPAAAKPSAPYEAYSARDWASWSEGTRQAFVKKYGKKPTGVQ